MQRALCTTVISGQTVEQENIHTNVHKYKPKSCIADIQRCHNANIYANNIKIIQKLVHYIHSAVIKLDFQLIQQNTTKLINEKKIFSDFLN